MFSCSKEFVNKFFYRGSTGTFLVYFQEILPFILICKDMHLFDRHMQINKRFLKINQQYFAISFCMNILVKYNIEESAQFTILHLKRFHPVVQCLILKKVFSILSLKKS